MTSLIQEADGRTGVLPMARYFREEVTQSPEPLPDVTSSKKSCGGSGGQESGAHESYGSLDVSRTS